MADAADSKSVGRKAVWVRLPPPAPINRLCFPLHDARGFFVCPPCVCFPSLDSRVLEQTSCPRLRCGASCDSKIALR